MTLLDEGIVDIRAFRATENPNTTAIEYIICNRIHWETRVKTQAATVNILVNIDIDVETAETHIRRRLNEVN